MESTLHRSDTGTPRGALMKLLLIPIAVAGALTLSAVSAAGAPIGAARSTTPAATIAPKALPALTTADWAGFRDQAVHTGANHAETTLTPAAVSGLHVVSSFASLDNQVTAQSGATGHGLLFASTRAGALAAYDESTHALRWTATPGSDDIAVGPSAVYTVSAASSGSTGDVTAYDVSTGARLWQWPLTGVSSINPPTLAGGRLLVTYATTAATNVVLDLNAATGKRTWQHVVAAPYVPSSAAVGSQVVVLTTGNDELLALNAATGAQLWSATSKGAGTPSSGAGGRERRGLQRLCRRHGAGLRPGHGCTAVVEGARRTAVRRARPQPGPALRDPLHDGSGRRPGRAAGLHGRGRLVDVRARRRESPTFADGVVYVARTDTSSGLEVFRASTGTLLAQVALSQYASRRRWCPTGRSTSASAWARPTSSASDVVRRGRGPGRGRAAPRRTRRSPLAVDQVDLEDPVAARGRRGRGGASAGRCRGRCRTRCRRRRSSRAGTPRPGARRSVPPNSQPACLGQPADVREELLAGDVGVARRSEPRPGGHRPPGGRRAVAA